MTEHTDAAINTDAAANAAGAVDTAPQPDASDTTAPVPAGVSSDPVLARRPSPTSRARRAAAAGVEAEGTGPRPAPGRRPGTPRPAADPVIEDGVTAGTSGRATATLAKPADRPAAGRTGLGATARRRLLLTLSALAIVLLAVNVVLLLIPVHKSSSNADRDQVLSAAKSDTALVISYNYKTIDADAAKAVPQLTGAFAADYQKSINTVIKVQAPKLKAVVEGQVDSAAIEAVSGDGKQVTVIVFGQQKVTNSTLAQPRTDLVRLRVTMDRVGNGWKIAQIAQI